MEEKPRSPRERAFSEAAKLNAHGSKVTVRAIRENAGVSQAIAQEAARAFSVTRDGVDAGRETPASLVALTRSLFNDLAAEAYSIYGAQIDRRDNEAAVLEQARDELEARCADLELNFALATQEISKKESALTASMLERERLKVSLEHYKQSNSDLNDTLASHKLENQGLQDELLSARKETADASHLIKSLESQVAVLQNMVAAATTLNQPHQKQDDKA